MTEPNPVHISANASGWGDNETLNGMRLRKAARVLVFDPAGRVLLVRGQDANMPERHWWFTIGGGIDGTETALAAAVREVQEETGITLDPTQLVGPVLERTAVFDFAAEHCVQQEVFFMIKLDRVPDLNKQGWTEDESSFLLELAWLTPQEILDSPIEVFPANLGEIVQTLNAGWDGTVMKLGIIRE